MSTSCVSFAKINSYLKIVGTREDGYHELKTCFIRLSEPTDTIVFTVLEGSKNFKLNCPSVLGAEENNIIYKAWKRFGEETDFYPSLDISVIKNIPQGAGLGGGSGNAACALLYLNNLAGNKKLSLKKLLALGAKIGADVPFFLLNTQAALAEGIGEKLQKIANPLQNKYILILCPPNIAINTAEMFKKWDNFEKNAKQVLTKITVLDKNTNLGLKDIYNDFEHIVYPLYPKILELKKTLLEKYDANSASLSGTGAALFGVFDTLEKAQKAQQGFAQEKIQGYLQRF